MSTGNLVTASVTIQGTRPMLWNAFGRDAIPLPNAKREKTGVAGNDPEEWKRTVLKTASGQLYVKPQGIFGCLRDAARFTKKGRGTIRDDLSSTLQVLDDAVLVDRYLPDDVREKENDMEDLEVYIDVRSVRNPATKGRNVRYRIATKPGWVVTFEIMWDKTVVGVTTMKSIIEDASKLIGLGDGRNIGFGRFELVSFETRD